MLPKEVIYHIIQILDDNNELRTISHMIRVCKTWKKWIENNHVLYSTYKRKRQKCLSQELYDLVGKYAYTNEFSRGSIHVILKCN